MYKPFLFLSFSSCLLGMHQETDTEFIARVRQKVENGADDRLVISPGKQVAWILCDKVTQKDVLRYDDAMKPFAPRKMILSKTKDGYRAFFLDFNRQLTKLIVFYRVDEYDIIDVNKIEYDI